MAGKAGKQKAEVKKQKRVKYSYPKRINICSRRERITKSIRSWARIRPWKTVRKGYLLRYGRRMRRAFM